MTTDKSITFVDTSDKELFTVADKGFIKMTTESGAMAIRQCHFVNDQVFQLEYYRYQVNDFAEYINEIGVHVQPMQTQGFEIATGYRITDRTVIGRTTVVIGHNPKAPDPYVTWRGERNQPHYMIGRYFKDKAAAYQNYQERIKDLKEQERKLFSPKECFIRKRDEHER